MTDTPSFQDLLDDFADEVFVGRSEQLSLFEGALTAERPSFLILNISGQGGVGKSTLLERYRGVSKNNNVAYASVNEDQMTIPKILEKFVVQLETSNVNFDRFNERYRKYQELNEKVEADPKAPSGLLDFALRGVARAGIKGIKRLPVAGDLADAFLKPEAEEMIVDQASELTKYVFQRFTNKDERVLLLDTNAELTRYFLEDLTKALKKKKVVLSFDTYEKTSDTIEKWLLDMLSGTFGKFGGGVLFVIAGRYALGQNWTRFRKAIRQLELKEFTENEARDYLLRSGITDEKLISQFIESSERLPVLLALLVSAPGLLPHDVSGDAVERFLEGLEPQQKEAALISSLPRYFNNDILVSILGEPEGKNAFEWLSKAHFVRTSENGWVYHDVVRAMMLRYFRLRSNQQFVQKHKLLEEYYQKQVSVLGIALDVQKKSALTSRLEAEKSYHFLWQNPAKNVRVLAKSFIATLWKIMNGITENLITQKKEEETLELLRISYSNPLFHLCEEISDLVAKEELDNFRNLAGFISDSSFDDMQSLLNWLFTIEDLDDQDKSMLFIMRSVSLRDANEQSFNSERVFNDLNKVIQLNPSSGLAHFARGQFHNDVKNYDLALMDFSKSIDLVPESAYAFNGRGRTYYAMKDYPSAVTDFSKAIELQPENGNNYYWRGRAHDRMDDYPSALSDLSKAIELQPENGYFYQWRGSTYYDMEDYPSAVTDFSKAIELQPENGNNYYWRGRAHDRMKDNQSALNDFTKAIELQPEDGDNYYYRGQTYDAMKDYPFALSDFSKAIELQPERGDFYNWRGLIYYAMKDYPSALNDFSKAIELQPDDGNNHLCRGQTYFEMDDNPSALNDLSKAIELQPERGDFYNWRGLIYYAMKDYLSALNDFTKAIELQPEDGDNYYWRGRTCNAIKDYPFALSDFTKAIELQPEDGTNYYWRGLTNYEMKKYSSALPDFTKAIELQPENGHNYYWRGGTYRNMKEYSSAVNDFTKAIELQPENGDNYYWRGRTYRNMKEYSSAVNDFTKAIELQPENGKNYSGRGGTYRNMKEYSSAVNDFTKAIEFQPEDGDNYYWRGRTYHELKDYLSALNDFSMAIELQPEDGYNYYWRGRIFYHSKDYPLALVDFTKAIELHPEDGFNYYRRALCRYSMKNQDGFREDIQVAMAKIKANYDQNEDPHTAFRLSLCTFANGEDEKAVGLYSNAVVHCTNSKDLEVALENLDELITAIGKTAGMDNIAGLLREALAKL